MLLALKRNLITILFLGPYSLAWIIFCIRALFGNSSDKNLEDMVNIMVFILVAIAFYTIIIGSLIIKSAAKQRRTYWRILLATYSPAILFFVLALLLSIIKTH